MRRTLVTVAALVLVVVLPAAALGARPAGTTKISSAGAGFIAVDPLDKNTCYRLTTTMLYDRFRDVAGDPGAPSDYAQLTVSLDQYVCGGDVEVSEPVGMGLPDGSYLIKDLDSAYVDVDFTLPGTERTLHFWLAWVAYGPLHQATDTQGPTKVVSWESDAKLAGTVTDESAGLTWVPDGAGMSLGTYVFGQ